MANNYFQFKQFKIVQQNSAMKVGTDGVLLGAWTNVENVTSVLDIGTGTGLIALMMAQRTKAQIVGVEIDKAAAGEAIENVKNSHWRERISIKNSSFQDFIKSEKNRFDLIISNPPFFTNSFKNKSETRRIARHNDLLPFSDLTRGAAKLLKQHGRLAVILPVDPAKEFIENAKNNGLYIVRQTKVQPKKPKDYNRILMEFALQEKKPVNNTLTIYLEDSSDYTNEFKALVRNFYLYENKR